MSSIQEQVLSQASGSNLVPLLITKFSRQFVPERANCSLSTSRENKIMCSKFHLHDLETVENVPLNFLNTSNIKTY